MIKPDFCIYAKTKKQISGAVTAQLISAFVFATRIVQSIVQSLYFLNPKYFKPLVIFIDCTAWFVSYLVGNLEDRFSHNEAQLLQILILLFAVEAKFLTPNMCQRSQ